MTWLGPGRVAAAIALTVALVSIPSAARAAVRYDPRLHFRSLDTPHFTIYFHQGEERLAQRLAAIAERVHAKLAPELGVSIDKHTHVILVDQHDEANGWATPLPYNTIEIAAAAPDPASVIGYTDDWLTLVFTHEYTHILHLDRSRGVFGGLRYVFGRAPVLFPNVFLAGWATEGLAVYEESTQTGQGRLAEGDFRNILTTAARAGSFEPMNRATGALIGWPGGNTQYAYGGYFHEYLADRFGAERLATLADATSGRVPYFPGAAYKRVFGETAGELWSDFRRDMTARACAAVPEPAVVHGPSTSSRPCTTAGSGTAVSRLTHHGYIVGGARWTPDGKSLVYSISNAEGFPKLMEIAASGGAPRTLATRYGGSAAGVTSEWLFFDQQDLVRSIALQSDLYALERASGRTVRLTSGARAFDVDVSPDHARIVAAVEQDGRAKLVIYPLTMRDGEPVLGRASVLVDQADTQFAAPRFSPDGARIAAERRTLGVRPHVVVIDAATGAVTAHADAARGRLAQPVWRGNSELLVAWEAPREPFNLFAVSLEGSARLMLSLPAGARDAAISPDGHTLAFIGYTTLGFDLFTTPLPSSVAAPQHVEDIRVTAGDLDPRPIPTSDIASRAYSPMQTIAPRFWMPVAATDDDRLELGAATAGTDVLGRHSYGATVLWSDRVRPDWSVAYAYDRWRPTLIAAASENVTTWQGQDYRETAVDLGAVLPFRTVRHVQQLFTALHLSHETGPEAPRDTHAVRLGYVFANAKSYGYSISPENGIIAGGATELTRAASYSATASTITGDVRAYARGGIRHAVLALRAATGASTGDDAARRVLGAGGAAASGSPISFSRDAIGLLRGFAPDDVIGYRALVFNADYRLPLVRIERGLGKLPVFLQQLHAAVFVDAANAWVRQFDAGAFRTSAGAELSLDGTLGHYLPLTAAAGVAWRRDPTGAVAGGTAGFARIGYAF